MAQWLVTQGDHQFSVDGMARLKGLAQAGQLAPGDMIQPPGSNEWVYASEVPELRKLIEQNHVPDEPRRSGPSVALLGLLGLLFAGILAGAVFALFVYGNELAEERGAILGDKGLKFTEMIVTGEGVSLTRDAGGGSTVGAVAKDEILDLLAKRGEWYKARTRGGVEGWVGVQQVIAMYQYGGADVRREFDPLYNPDRYIQVSNASWTELPDKEEGSVTVFRFQMSNPTKYDMVDLVLRATIKDGQGHQIDQVEFRVEGVVPADGTALVGTLAPEAAVGDAEPAAERVMTDVTLAELAEGDPDVQLRFSDGVEVPVATTEFVSAQIDVVELRAIPK